MFSSKGRCYLCLHHEDDSGDQNGSVGQKIGAEQERHVQWCSTSNRKPFPHQVRLLQSFQKIARSIPECFSKHLKNFVPGVCRDRSIEVAAYFRIVASLGYLPVNRLLAEMGSHTPNPQNNRTTVNSCWIVALERLRPLDSNPERYSPISAFVTDERERWKMGRPETGQQPGRT